MEKNYFTELNDINVNGKTESKNGLTYLSWAWAWGELKKRHPDATYTIYENPAMGGMPYYTDGKTAMCKVSVTVGDITHVEWLPVMDHRNNSIPLERIDSFAVNKTIQRALTKAVARHGLGLYIYAGEDLPDCEEDDGQPKPKPKASIPAKSAPKPAPKPATKDGDLVCKKCGSTITAAAISGQVRTAQQIAEVSTKRFGTCLCGKCYQIAMLKNKEADESHGE